MDPLILLSIGIAAVLGGILVLKMHPFLALTLAALLVAAFTPEEGILNYAASKELSEPAAQKIVDQTIGRRVAAAFGGIATKVGLAIALAALIGKCLLESGAADRIVRSFLAGVGEKRAALAFMLSGFLLGIPVFFDTVFFLMIPLVRTLCLRTGKNYGLYIMSVIAGGSISHSLVPPTPGPLLVAGELNVQMGEMIIAGIVIGSIATLSGYAYARWHDTRFQLPLRETEEGQFEQLKKLAEKPLSELPGLFASLAPIVLPLIFITVQTVLSSPFGQKQFPHLDPVLLNTIRTLGDPIVALTIATLIALATLIHQKKTELKETMATLPPALKDAGMIILITSAGGAFGGILQQTGIGPRLEGLSGGMTLAVLPLAWLITAVVRVAQGSATVAMITAVGIVGGMATDNLGFNPVYLAIAIGCGSKMLPWFNDSGFWVICKMSGFTEKETLQTFTPLLSIMGIVGLIATMILAKLWPMI